MRKLVNTAYLLVALSPVCAFGQHVQDALALPSGFAKQTSDQPGILQITVNELQLSCIVQDQHSAPIPGLKTEDFAVFIDKQPSQLQAVASDSDVPLDVSLLLDVSSSQRGMLGIYGDAVRGLVSAMDKKRDNISIYTFGSDVRLFRDWQSAGTIDPNLIDHLDSKEGLLLEKHPFYTHGGTRLFDALRYAIDNSAKRKGRRAIVVLSDGIDEGSSTSSGDIIKAADKGDVSISALEFHPSGLAFLSPSLPLKEVHDSLAAASRASGGIFQRAKAGEEKKQLDMLIANLKAEYVLYIKPPTMSPGVHAVSIRLKIPQPWAVLTHNKIWIAGRVPSN